MINYRDSSPGDAFEDLSGAVFGATEKWGDPWGYSAQEEFYSILFNKDLDSVEALKAKRKFSTVIIKMIFDNIDTKHVEKLKRLEDQVWEDMTRDNAQNILKNLVKIYNESHQN